MPAVGVNVYLGTMRSLPLYLGLVALLAMAGCAEEAKVTKCLRVKATAYNSLPYQTRPGSSGDITAWGDKLLDSVPSIAISRDLLDSGLHYGTLVTISGFKQPFVVNDKMHYRYTNRIDIHMGKDVQAAREFGVKEVGICWEILALDSANLPPEGL